MKYGRMIMNDETQGLIC